MKTKTYPINEIFHSLQGEGLWVGAPMVFVRFAGCNLHCLFCDTPHDVQCQLTRTEILNDVLSYPDGTAVCFTGGEPLLSLDIPLINLLWAQRPLHLETNGTLTPPAPERFRSITISPKSLPGPALEALLAGPHDNCELKIVWDPTTPLFDKVLRAWEDIPFKRRYLQPLMTRDGKTNVHEVIQYVKVHPTWNLSIQVHKILGLR